MEVVKVSLALFLCAVVVTGSSTTCSDISCWESMLDRVKEAEFRVKQMDGEIAKTHGAFISLLEAQNRRIEELAGGRIVAGGGFLTGPVAFSVYGPAKTNVASGEIIKYTNVQLNKGDNYESSTGMFTAPVSGLYQFSATMCNSLGNFVVYAIVKGSESVAITTQWDDSDSCNSVQAVAMVNAGEGVFVRCDYSLAGTELYENGNRRNAFTGVLLQATYEPCDD